MKNKKNTKLKIENHSSGFTLVETLLAISIFSISIVVMMSVLSGGVADTNYTEQKIIANYLAQEGVEYVRNLRDTLMLYNINGPAAGWGALKNKLTAAGCLSDNGCYFNPAGLNYESISESVANLQVISCTGACPIISYNVADGEYGYNGSALGYRRKIQFLNVNVNEIKITSTVTWEKESQTYSTAFTENLFNWIE